MSIEPAPKIFLQNKLSRSRASSQDLGPLISSKRQCFPVARSPNRAHRFSAFTESELDHLTRRLKDSPVGHSIGEIDDLVDVGTGPPFIYGQIELSLGTPSDVIGGSGCRAIWRPDTNSYFITIRGVFWRLRSKLSYRRLEVGERNHVNTHS
jgi:hypothetical protein